MTSTLVAVLIGAIGMLAWVFSGGRTTVLAAFVPELVFSGQVWRLFTWPLAESISLWSILTLVMLWYFGREVEASIGRNAMARLFMGIWVSLTAAAVIIGVLLPGVFLAGLNLVQFAILLLFIWLPFAALAQVKGDVAPPVFRDGFEEARFRDLTHELRCVMCQNQSLADSNAEIARDLRNALVSSGMPEAQAKSLVATVRARGYRLGLAPAEVVIEP